MLDRAKIGTRCREDWDNMAGDDRARFCGRCQKTVYNLSAMTEAEAEAVLKMGLDAPPCIRFTRFTDGRVRTTDRLPRLALTAGLAAAAIAALNAPGLPPRPAAFHAPIDAPIPEAAQAGTEIAQNLPIPEINGPAVSPPLPPTPPPAPPPDPNVDEMWMGDYAY